MNGCVRITLGTVNQTKKLAEALRQVTKEINPVLIFDIDGVLADVSASYRLAIRKTSKFFTRADISFQEIQGYKNKGGFNNDWDLTERIIRERGVNAEKILIIKKFLAAN